jgi:hypothetical protein
MRALAMNLAVPAGGTVSGPSISRFVIVGVVLGRNGEIGTCPESHAARLPASARAIPEWTRSRVDFMMPPIWLLTKSSSAVPLNVRQEETGQGLCAREGAGPRIARSSWSTTPGLHG